MQIPITGSNVKRAQPFWTGGHTAGIFAVIVAIPVGAWLVISAGYPLWAWLLTFALIWVFLLIVGHGIIHLWRGVVIDDRNVISLSRVQMVIWTVILLSAYFTGALWNIYMGLENPLAIGIPTEVWALLGISTTSLIGTPLILSPKKDRQAMDSDIEDARNLYKQQGKDPDEIDNRGQVMTNKTPGEAEWSDMFTGDEVINGLHLDMTKVQMFFFTVIVAIAYCVALGRLFVAADAGGLDAFPMLDASLLAILGISHGGYLVGKGSPHSPHTPKKQGE